MHVWIWVQVDELIQGAVSVNTLEELVDFDLENAYMQIFLLVV